jgi:multidrug efflux pump subunit AcrB
VPTLKALVLGVIFIYLVLASQFESFVHPLTIMMTLPLALIGAIAGLFISGYTLSMSAMIGVVLLMGLVTKNAILLVDRAIERVRVRGETPLAAMLEAGPERLRPISHLASGRQSIKRSEPVAVPGVYMTFKRRSRLRMSRSHAGR